MKPSPPIDRLPPNVTMDASGIPEAAVDEVLANSYFLVTRTTTRSISRSPNVSSGAAISPTLA
ncbi:MAG: hypothetical protein CBARDMAM_3510 [uncultured Caballeronia sp.]|nr:MAG: hypothetical protein CBARDMAM_3510 [uncultured Caballeronia sp.]